MASIAHHSVGKMEKNRGEKKKKRSSLLQFIVVYFCVCFTQSVHVTCRMSKYVPAVCYWAMNRARIERVLCPTSAP